MSYNPKRWLRALSRPLLGELARERTGTEDWASERLSFDDLFAGWRELPEAARLEIDRVLQGVDLMATPEAMQVAFEEGKAAGVDLLSPTSAFPCLARHFLHYCPVCRGDCRCVGDLLYSYFQFQCGDGWRFCGQWFWGSFA